MQRPNPNCMGAFVTIITQNVNPIFKQLFIIVYALFLAGNVAIAEQQISPDFKLGFNGRTYPIGVQLMGNAGLGYPIWGDTDTWKYGYVRAGLNIMTSAVVNRAGIELQVFPISIFGVTAGYDTGVRNFVPKWLNCDLYECVGRVDRKFLRVNAAAAYEDFSMMLMSRYEELRGFGATPKLVFDETTLVVGRPNGENIFTLNPALLYRIDDSMGVGFASLYSHAIDTGGYSHLYGPIVNLTTSPKFSMILGAGLNSSPIVHSGFCGFFLLQYNVKPSLSVMDLKARLATQGVSESPAL